jgi:hypothetical protein
MALMQKSKTALSWTGLVQSGLEYGHARGLINDAQHARYLSALASDEYRRPSRRRGVCRAKTRSA